MGDQLFIETLQHQGTDAATKSFSSPQEAVSYLCELYHGQIAFLQKSFNSTITQKGATCRYRGFYPQISITTYGHTKIDSRLSFGHVTAPDTYATTITRPDLFKGYLYHQIELLISNHEVPVEIGLSDTPIPIHFAMSTGQTEIEEAPQSVTFAMRDHFDVPELDLINDEIINDTYVRPAGAPRPLALFPALRVDYSLARLSHYTATDPEHFQNFILFTNYQFYVDEFERIARDALGDPASGYSAFVAPGNHEITAPDGVLEPLQKLPQMPTYHLKRPDGNGITLVNIGVGPSNAKTATDHIGVLRPHAWIMVGHCAGLRNSQQLGDFVLAHAYLREDKVLDDDLPAWIPIPALAEVQVALEQAVAAVTEAEHYEIKSLMRTGTVVSVDNRNWELRNSAGPIHRLSQSRAIALDMESATIAANGFRFRVPYGTLLCVSDKPLHGELKLPGMASEFYKSQVARHLQIGIKTIDYLRDMPLERLHSRKLRSFDETAFL